MNGPPHSRTIARLALWGTSNPLELAVSDASGNASVRIPRELVDHVGISATWRGKTSLPVALRSGDEPIVLRLPE